MLNTDYPQPPANTKLLKRLFSKIKVSTKHSYNGIPCWEWTTTQFYKSGYGRFGLNKNKSLMAHKVFYLLFVGDIPDSLVCDHLCRVRHCVNPAHIEIVTQQVNILRGVSSQAENAQKTHCPRGHAYTHVDKRGSRNCYICKRVQCRNSRIRVHGHRRPKSKSVKNLPSSVPAD